MLGSPLRPGNLWPSGPEFMVIRARVHGHQGQKCTCLGSGVTIGHKMMSSGESASDFGIGHLTSSVPGYAKHAD